LLNPKTEQCPLCHSQSRTFYRELFFICSQCRGIFRSKDDFPTPTKEKARYELHQNDIQDQGYKDFVSPLIKAVLTNQKPENSGLDFGSGSEAVLSEIIKGYGYNVKAYDPFFRNTQEFLNNSYDYVICCEVIEHFHNPGKEFELLKRLLKPSGSLYCMTHIYDESIDFSCWYYKNDFTHVFFYQKDTLEWIRANFGFREIVILDRLIHLKC